LHQENVDNDLVSKTLNDKRSQIDTFNDELLEILGARMKISDRISRYKKDNNITILQSSRWDRLLTKVIKEGAAKGLGECFVVKVFRAIHQESINHQIQIMSK